MILEASVNSIDRLSSSSSISSRIRFNEDGRNRLVVHYSSSTQDISRENTANSDQMTSKVESDMVVHDASRVPNIDGLDLLNAGGIQFTHRGISK